MMVLNRARSLPSVSLDTKCIIELQSASSNYKVHHRITKCIIELQSSVTFDAAVDAIVDATVDPTAGVTVNDTVNDTISATADSDPTTDGPPDIFLITLGIPPYLNITGLGATGIESLDIDSKVYMICKDEAIIDIIAGLDQRYKRHDRVMGLSRNGKCIESWQSAFYLWLGKRMPTLKTFRVISPLAAKGDFHEQHEFMRPEYFSGKAPKPVYVKDRDNVERFFKEVHKDLMRRTDRFLTMMEWVDVVRQTWRLFQTEKLLLERFLEILLRDVDKEKARLRRDRADLIPLVNFDIYGSGSTYV
ncbi:hypothetical protein TWF751_006017 [Orbilia oligospora]|nr:hypothetical protein TWF751_006017 [Orbilia oligospora]